MGNGVPDRGPANQRKGKFIETLKHVVEGRAGRGASLDPDELLVEVGARMGTVLVRSTFEHERVSAPFPQPDGFMYPPVPPRRMTARRRDTLVSQLGAKRAETRRLAVHSLGRALDDATVVAALRTASQEDPDPYVRGESLMCLGLTDSEAVEPLLADALRLASDVSETDPGTPSNDLAREGAAYGVLGALLAATRDGRRDLAPVLRSLAESLDPRPTVDHSNLPSRQRRVLIELVADLDRR
jgi:hypothetical protein